MVVAGVPNPPNAGLAAVVDPNPPNPPAFVVDVAGAVDVPNPPNPPAAGAGVVDKPKPDEAGCEVAPNPVEGAAVPNPPVVGAVDVAPNKFEVAAAGCCIPNPPKPIYNEC